MTRQHLADDVQQQQQRWQIGTRWPTAPRSGGTGINWAPPYATGTDEDDDDDAASSGFPLGRAAAAAAAGPLLSLSSSQRQQQWLR